MTEYSMYGAVPLRSIKQALLAREGRGPADRVKLLDLTNCTFDGHIYNTRRVMEECLAIKPDLIFLWDEAWFGFARWSPFLRPRTAMGAAADIEAWLRDPASAKPTRRSTRTGRATHRMPHCWIRGSFRIRARSDCASIRRTRPTNRCPPLRQGSMVLVKDVDYHAVEEQFHEAVFTHASTSPNQQLIASLDVARRQMELEGFGLVMNAIEIALDDPARSEAASADLQILPHARRGWNDPGRVPSDRLHRLSRSGRQLGQRTAQHARGRVLSRSDPDDARLRHRGL